MVNIQGDYGTNIKTCNYFNLITCGYIQAKKASPNREKLYIFPVQTLLT